MQKNQSPLMFPCKFPIKVMGLADDEFKTAVLKIFHKHFPRLKKDAINLRVSKEKKYLSITVTIKATSKKQLDAIYQELSDNPAVLMAL
ncbi:MAG: DUF493 domain-containing protein [Gammaproteobacteria bacterium]|nr:DUF493 domain-containing protein [Gammaproteobacteria bacterium]